MDEMSHLNMLEQIVLKAHRESLSAQWTGKKNMPMLPFGVK